MNDWLLDDPAPEDDNVPRPVQRRALTEATRSMSALLGAGLPLAKAIETTGDVVEGRLSFVLSQVLQSIRQGASFADALAAQGDVFSPLYVGVVRAGEKSGRLGRIMDRLADELERQDELRSRVVSAAVYPLVLILLGTASVLVLLLAVVPRFGELLLDTGAELPPMTTALLGTSTLFRGSGLYLATGLCALVLGGLVYFTSEQGRRALARWSLETPIVGPLRRSLLAARFSRLLGVLLEGGAPVVSALSDAADSLPDPLAREEVHRVREAVRAGASLHRSIGEGAVFPTELSRLVAVGEESGRLAEFLERAADLLERRAVRTIERAIPLLEPAVIVVFGGIVAVVALALLQAIYGVNAGAFS